MKNKFLFFEKGKKQISKNTNSLLSGLYNDKTDSDYNLACSTILRKNSVTDFNHQLQPLSLVLEKTPAILSPMNESQILSEKPKVKDIMKYHISPRETNLHFKKQSINKTGLTKFKDHKKLVDPMKFKVFFF